VDPVEQVGVSTAQTVTAVDQQPQRHGHVVDDDLPQTLAAQRRDRDAVRIDRISLTALTGVEHPRPGGQLRGHVHHDLAVGDQALSDVLTDAVAAFDRQIRSLCCRPSLSIIW
jgi:hypothetical protein